MRVLFTTQPGSGHWRPLAPVARALTDAGHDAAFAMTPAFCEIITHYGFRCFPAGIDDHPADHSRPAAHNRASGNADPDPASTVWADAFAGFRAHQSLPDLMSIARSWQPDLIVREISEFAGCVVAERLDLPHVAVQVSAFRPPLHRVIEAPLRRLRLAAGLPAAPALAMLYRYVLFSLAPPSFQPRAESLPATTRFIGYTPFDHLPAEPPADWRSRLPPRPMVFATPGTAYNRTPDILAMIQDALGHEPVNLIVATGEREQIDLQRKGKRLWTASYLPESVVFPSCEAVICHGGFNTVMTAIAFGKPLVIVPIAADQPDNAARCRDLGLGTVVEPTNRTPLALRDAVRAVFSEPQYRERAEDLCAEMRSQPGPESALPLLERLAHQRGSGSPT